MYTVDSTVEIKADLDVVWSVLATQEGMRQWMSPNIEIEMREGGAYRFLELEHQAVISGHVLEIEPGRSLSISWFEEGSNWTNPLRVVFTLEPIPGGTRVHRRFEGFESIGKPTWERTHQAYTRGAELSSDLRNLKEAAEAAHARRD